MIHTEFTDQEALKELLSTESVILNHTFRGINFYNELESLSNVKFKHCVFMGCTIPSTYLTIILNDNAVFPDLDVPYNIYNTKLYNVNTLFSNYELGNPESYDNTLDSIVYDHYINTGKFSKNVRETLARSLHDHSITECLMDFLEEFKERKCIAIMGGT